MKRAVSYSRNLHLRIFRRWPSETGQQTPVAAQTPPAHCRQRHNRPPSVHHRPRRNPNLTPGKRRRRTRTRPLWRKRPTISPPNIPTANCASCSTRTRCACIKRRNNAEKIEAMGRKVLAIDGDDPEALNAVAEVIAGRTHDTDIDKDQRYD